MCEYISTKLSTGPAPGNSLARLRRWRKAQMTVIAVLICFSRKAKMIVLPYPVGRTTTRSLFIYCFQTFRVLRIQEPPPTTLAHRNRFWLYSHIQLSSDTCSCVAAWFLEQIVGLMFSSSTVVVNIKASNSRLLFLNLFWLYHLSTALLFAASDWYDIAESTDNVGRNTTGLNFGWTLMSMPKSSVARHSHRNYTWNLLFKIPARRHSLRDTTIYQWLPYKRL